VIWRNAWQDSRFIGGAGQDKNQVEIRPGLDTRELPHWHGPDVVDSGQPHSRRTPMKSGMKDKVEGNYHEAKGKVKEVAGKITGKAELEIAGQNEQIAGKVEKKIGKIKTGLGK
jgi:uncharacterized protein YjbJ (UPF0337 family)